MNQNDKIFIADAVENLTKHKVSTTFSAFKRISYGEEKDAKVGGYFLDVPKELQVATGIAFTKWFPVFVHEYCHFLQYIEKEPAYYAIKQRHSQLYSDFFETKIKTKDTVDAIRLIRNMEENCERRVVEIIERYGLSINVKRYIQGANAYIYFYTLFAENGIWTSKKGPYSIKAILDIMPDKFLDNYETLPKKYKTLVERYCYDKTKDL